MDHDKPPNAPWGSNGLPPRAPDDPAAAPQPGRSEQTPHPRAGAVEAGATPWDEPSWTSTMPWHGPVPPLVTRVSECTPLTSGLQGVMGPSELHLHGTCGNIMNRGDTMSH